MNDPKASITVRSEYALLNQQGKQKRVWKAWGWGGGGVLCPHDSSQGQGPKSLPLTLHRGAHENLTKGNLKEKDGKAEGRKSHSAIKERACKAAMVVEVVGS